jgi:hypothetical protein
MEDRVKNYEENLSIFMSSANATITDRALNVAKIDDVNIKNQPIPAHSPLQDE